MSTTPDPDSDSDLAPVPDSGRDPVADPDRDSGRGGPIGDVALAAVLHRRTCRDGHHPDRPPGRLPTGPAEAAAGAYADRRQVGYRPGWTPAVYRALTGPPSPGSPGDTATAALARHPD